MHIAVGAGGIFSLSVARTARGAGSSAARLLNVMKRQICLPRPCLGHYCVVYVTHVTALEQNGRSSC